MGNGTAYTTLRTPVTARTTTIQALVKNYIEFCTFKGRTNGANSGHNSGHNSGAYMQTLFKSRYKTTHIYIIYMSLIYSHHRFKSCPNTWLYIGNRGSSGWIFNQATLKIAFKKI